LSLSSVRVVRSTQMSMVPFPVRLSVPASGEEVEGDVGAELIEGPGFVGGFEV
jgi:hypothetical protein